MRSRRHLLAFAIGALAAFAAPAESARFRLTGEAVAEALPLAVRALGIQARAMERERRHVAELRARGLAEVPASRSERYRFRSGAVGDLGFDAWGGFYIDRRFVTEEEMATVRAIEAWFAKWVFGDAGGARRERAGTGGLPVFCGFEDARYQRHDALIARLVAEFNADKASGCGGTASQARAIPDLSPALVKAQMIEESGGGGEVSLAAWARDPLQVNVPGDWGEEKRELGLTRPAVRNEGELEANVRAAIRYLSRKGFGKSGRPASRRPAGFFDGWRTALRRYNGRRDRTGTDRYYSDEYADKIVRRAENPDLFVPIETKLAR